MFLEDVLKTRAGQRLAASADEDLGRRHGAPHGQPRAQRHGGHFPQGQAALASTFTMHEHTRLRLKRDVAELQAHELRHP
jgi:hypothetical protein